MYLIEKTFQIISDPSGKKDGLASLKINVLLSQFAVGMIDVFGVIFVFQLADNLLTGLYYVLLFFLLQRIVVVLTIPIFGVLISKYGYRVSMILGTLFKAGKLFLLVQASLGNVSLLLPALILGGLSIPSYYLSFHALFLDDNDNAKIGEQIGYITMLAKLAMVVSPFLAGLLIGVFGFSFMFTVSMIILLISVVPLLMMKTHKRHKSSYSFKKVWKTIYTKNKFSLSLFFWSLTAGFQLFLWPVYMFLVLGSYILLGIIGSIVMIANSIALFVAGKLYDESNHKRMFKTSSILVSLTWIARFMSVSPLGIVISDSLNRLFSPFWWMKIRRYELVEGEKIDGLVFAAAHEYVVTFGLIAGLILGVLILVMTQGSWIMVGVTAVVATTISTLILKDE